MGPVRQHLDADFTEALVFAPKAARPEKQWEQEREAGAKSTDPFVTRRHNGAKGIAPGLPKPPWGLHCLMTATLNAFTQDGFCVFSFPESAVPASVRDDFIATVKAEWLARQSRLSEADAKSLADTIDASWWQQNKVRILGNTSEE